MLRDKIKEELKLLSEQQLDYDRSGGELTRDWWRAKLQSDIIYLINNIDEYMYETRRTNGEYNEFGQFVMLDELRPFSNAEIAGILDKVMRTLPPTQGLPPEY